MPREFFAGLDMRQNIPDILLIDWMNWTNQLYDFPWVDIEDFFGQNCVLAIDGEFL